MSIETEDVKTEGVMFETPEDQKLWDLAPTMLKLVKLLECAQQEIDKDEAEEIRKTADEMAISLMLKFRA